MNDIFSAIADAGIWQLVAGVVLAVAGSSAASAWISGGFESTRASKGFKREVRTAALESAGAAYAAYSRYGNLADLPAYDEERDRIISEVSALVEARVGAIGDPALLPLVVNLVGAGELFASQDEDTNVEALHSAYSKLVFELSKGIPEK